MYNKERTIFPVDSNRIVSIINNDPNLIKYEKSILYIRNPIFKRFLFDIRIIIDKEHLDIQILLKKRKIYSRINGNSKKIQTTLVSIGPDIIYMQKYIDLIKKNLEQELNKENENTDTRY